MSSSAKTQLGYLKKWCMEERVDPNKLFALIEFNASTDNLPSQTNRLRRTISDWSANSTGQAAQRLFALTELVREKAQIEGQGRNIIRREDVLTALDCDQDQLFPADTDEQAQESQKKLSLLGFAGTPAYRLAQHMDKDVWLYEFTHVPTDKPGFPNYGAFHTSEVPFALHTLNQWNRQWKPEEQRLEDQMSG